MIATQPEAESPKAECRPRLLAYHWTHDEDVTHETVAGYAEGAADYYDVAGPVWYIDEDRAELFNDRPEAKRFLAEIRPNDQVLLSLTSAPLVVDWHVTACRLLRRSPHVHAIDPDGNAIEVDDELLRAIENYILGICRGPDK